MCFSKPKPVEIPKPQPAPAPPSKEKANFEAVSEQRRALSDRKGRASTLLSRVGNEDFAAIGTKKKLGGE